MSKRRKTPTEVIENVRNPDLESIWVKSRGRLTDVSGERFQSRVTLSQKKMKTLALANKFLHTHTHWGKIYVPYTRWNMPSRGDLVHFLTRPEDKTMIIAETQEDTGKVLSYTFLRKTEKTPLDLKPKNPNLQKNVLAYGSRFAEFEFDSKMRETDLKKFCKKYGLLYRQVPVEENLGKVNENGNRYLLENRVTVFIISLIGGFALSLQSLTSTGRVISNLTGTSQGLLGVLFFIVGLTGLFLNRKKL